MYFRLFHPLRKCRKSNPWALVEFLQLPHRYMEFLLTYSTFSSGSLKTIHSWCLEQLPKESGSISSAVDRALHLYVSGSTCPCGFCNLLPPQRSDLRCVYSLSVWGSGWWPSSWTAWSHPEFCPAPRNSWLNSSGSLMVWTYQVRANNQEEFWVQRFTGSHILSKANVLLLYYLDIKPNFLLLLKSP